MPNPKTEKLESDFLELIEANPAQALAMITGMFVGLTVHLTRLRGHDADKQIVIVGSADQRRITIHAATGASTSD